MIRTLRRTLSPILILCLFIGPATGIFADKIEVDREVLEECLICFEEDKVKDEEHEAIVDSLTRELNVERERADVYKDRWETADRHTLIGWIVSFIVLVIAIVGWAL